VPRRFPPLLDLARSAVRRFNDDHCMQIAGSLTFTTLLSIVPLATVALTVISAFPVFREMNEALESFVMENLMPDPADAIAAYTEQFRANAARLTALGLAFLVATAVMLMVTIEHAFNQIWRVRHPRSVFQRTIIYWTLLTVGPVLIGASLSLTSWLVSQSLGLVSGIPGAGVTLLKVVPVVLTSGALALLYLALPNRRVALKDALAGGVLAGLVFEASKRAFAWYVTHFASYKLVYGAFASVPIFLVWIYVSWLIVISGAVVVAVLPEWRARSACKRPPAGADFLDALRILKVLWEAHQSGKVVRLARLHAAVGASIERMESLLEVMLAASWVGRAVPDARVLSQDPAGITLRAVYDLFVFRSDALAAANAAQAPFERLALELGAHAGAQLSLTLEEFLRRDAAQPREPARGETPAAGAV
jgi:membrane protein